MPKWTAVLDEADEPLLDVLTTASGPDIAAAWWAIGAGHGFAVVPNGDGTLALRFTPTVRARLQAARDGGCRQRTRGRVYAFARLSDTRGDAAQEGP